MDQELRVGGGGEGEGKGQEGKDERGEMHCGLVVTIAEV